MVILDAKTISVVAATVALGPPQAAPMAIKVLGPRLLDTLVLLSVGHLGSAAVLFAFFQVLSPVVDRLRSSFAALWARMRRSQGTRGSPTSLSFKAVSPGRKYFFLGTVGFVFAFGSFLGVAATQAVGMRRSRAFSAIMLGCALSVLFWGFLAFYLSKVIDPLWVTLAFVVVAVGLMFRGKILENRMVEELRSLRTDALRVLYLVGQDLSPERIAAKTQMRLEDTKRILHQLTDRGYIAATGRDLYEATSNGIESLGGVPDWILRALVDEARRKIDENT